MTSFEPMYCEGCKKELKPPQIYFRGILRVPYCQRCEEQWMERFGPDRWGSYASCHNLDPGERPSKVKLERKDFEKLAGIVGSMSALARGLDIPLRTLQQWVYGQNTPSAAVVSLIIHALNCEQLQKEIKARSKK